MRPTFRTIVILISRSERAYTRYTKALAATGSPSSADAVAAWNYFIRINNVISYLHKRALRIGV